MRSKGKKLITLLLSLALLLAALPVCAGADTIGFPDVPDDAWYRANLDKIIWAQQMVGQMNIITGYPDGSFRPDDQVKRGEWLKMLFEAAESSGNQTAILDAGAVKPGDHWAEKYYLKAKADAILVADVYSSTEPMFPGTGEALEQPITRYEMAVILNNLCTNLAMQKTVITEEP